MNLGLIVCFVKVERSFIDLCVSKIINCCFHYKFDTIISFNTHLFWTIGLRVFLLFTIILISCETVEFVDNAPQLEVTVLDESGSRVQQANVILYGSEMDWRNQSNPLQSKLTNSLGVVLFENLEEQVYYFYAQKYELSNQESISVLDKELQINVKALVTTVIK